MNINSSKIFKFLKPYPTGSKGNYHEDDYKDDLEFTSDSE